MTALHVYDFDGTLFRSPHVPAVWSGDWWSDPRSLVPPCVPDHPDSDWWVQPTVRSALRSIADQDVFAVLMTGRPLRSGHRFRVPELLKQRGLDFDRVFMTEGGDTLQFKVKTLRQLLTRYHHVTEVRLWDDRKHQAEVLSDVARKMGVQDVHVQVVRALPKDCPEGTKFTSAPKPGIKWIGVFLDSRSKGILAHTFPQAHPDDKGEHMTIAYQPSRDLLHLVGQRVSLDVIGYAEDDKAQAVVVRTDLPVERSVPHITVSVDPGTPGKYSNTLLEQGWERVDGPKLYGVVDVFPRSLTSKVASRYVEG